ncbi:hypothetical protein FN846DRAFT_970047 [Sphaerosporella brunnea]|uniref:DNA mismatch repair protein PMS1 n=1 Tax=Sphaerosporella brunnea TaxID=1250544 RepID=A0A5J5EJJ8_9PEZI|nr:hypothetical protein FN846DRAFT_970047 [Sphaerosporella brunnea]
MSALIQQIDSRSVHHIQSGQVINDGLNSAVKELVENALDAHATSIEIRFRNYGLESLEVADNGDGISPENYETVALKHYTSKLRTYADLESVTTFGFRGEALSSLCALSDFHIITATASEAPKGNKLEFENSGKLKSKSMVPTKKGTTVCVAHLFKSLPVRRRELERNIRRDYAKVLNLLQAYAGICVGVKFSVFNQPLKGKKSPVFATKGNPTTRENISNVFGSKTLAALVPLDLQFEMRPTKQPGIIQPKDTTSEYTHPPGRVVGSVNTKTHRSREVKIVGHISRPVVGEGRNAPDRQMFFVNGRPCVLPQISKAFNEVYKGFNITQSPFIFADLQLDTNAYDVNVSPDKRTILLHDQAELLESLKSSLTELFETHEQTVPVSQLGTTKLPYYRQTSLFSTPASSPLRGHRGQFIREQSSLNSPPSSPAGILRSSPPPTFGDDDDLYAPDVPKVSESSKEAPKYTLLAGLARFKNPALPFKPPTRVEKDVPFVSSTTADEMSMDIDDSPEREEAMEASMEKAIEQDIPSTQIPVSPRPPQARSQRRPDTQATITIGDRSPVTTGVDIGEEFPRKKRRIDDGPEKAVVPKPGTFDNTFSKFMAPGTQRSGADIFRSLETSLSMKSSEVMPEVDGDLEISNNEAEAMEAVGSESTSAEIYEDTAQQEPLGKEVQSGQDLEPELEMSRPNDLPLFLPDDRIDQGESEAEEELSEVPIVESIEIVSPPGMDGSDDEYIPDADAEAEAARRVSARASRLLKEVETYQVTHPIEQLLERNIRLLSNSHNVTTNGTVRFESTSVEQIRKHAQRVRGSSALLSSGTAKNGASEDLLNPQDEAAEQRLSLTVTKDDFMNMKIHGQFNKGFILATCNNELFIIDQHASDEKYNFETLQATTVVQNQPLVVPRILDLMAMDEIAVMDNLDVLKRNGFVVEVDLEMPTGRRCKLVSLPMSKETVFGIEDLEELIHLIHQHQGSGTSHLRCSKVRSMFAMRACRKSVMVGKALPTKAMEKIVRHMGELDKPWNCPHGRPTMRHLAELDYIERWTEKDEERGGGGLRWNGDTWQEVLAMAAGEVENEESHSVEDPA